MNYCKIHGICEFTLNNLIHYLKIEKIEKGNYFIKKGEHWKKVAVILRGRLKVKLDDNPIDEKKPHLDDPFENLKIGDNLVSPEILEKIKLHFDTPEKIIQFKNNLFKYNSEKIDPEYIKNNPLKNQSYFLADKKICNFL